MPRPTRRSFLAATASLAAASLWAHRAEGIVLRRVKVPDNLFTLGVASGDPAPTSVVIWTRLAPQPLEGGGMPDEAVEVAWEVAEDEQFAKVVRKGTLPAVPDWAHSVHVEVEGLEPDRCYWYRFHASGTDSPIGRTRTTPPADSLPERLRFAFASCQHFESGLFTAYEHMAKDDLDLVIHLGDYIYEGPATKLGVRKHVGPKLRSLDDYRNRHAQYKTDAALQATHAAFPWLVTWDDHEFDNNCAGDISAEQRGEPGRLPEAPRRGLSGLLRAHAAAAGVAPHGARHAALSPRRVRPAGGTVRARHAAVPHRPAARRRQQAAGRRGPRSQGDAAGC